MLQPLWFALHLNVLSVGLCLHLSPPVLKVSPLIRPMNALHPQYARQDVFTPAARRVRVQFAPGHASASLSGQVQGYQAIDYVLKANAQQRMTVSLTSERPFLLMGIYAPNGEALCVETCNGQWTGMLPHMGDYTIRIGLVRAEARRQGRASYTLKVSLTSP
jgi:hypothetical protein